MGVLSLFFPAPSHFVFVSGNLLQIILNAVANGLDLLHAQSMKDLYTLTQFFPPAPDPWSNISIRVRNIVVRVRFFALNPFACFTPKSGGKPALYGRVAL
jgi:hypothetical protein